MTKSEVLSENEWRNAAKPGTREALERVSAHTHRISFNFIKHDLPTQFSALELITLHVWLTSMVFLYKQVALVILDSIEQSIAHLIYHKEHKKKTDSSYYFPSTTDHTQIWQQMI